MDTKSVHGLGEVPVEPYKSWDQVPFVADGEDSYMGGSVERVIGRHGIFTGQPCVRKTIQLREIEEDKMKAAEDDFRKELKILGYARHHHVVTLVMAYALQTEKDKRLAIIMDHAEGGDLGNYLTNPQMIKKNLNNIAQWFSCLSSAVTYIHGIGIRHRDIKPANILVHDGKIRLSDFGISKMGLGRTLSTTIPEWARGRTEKYCAPEVEDGSSRGRSGDIFSLGAVFLEMLVAHSYFNQRSGLMGALAAIGGPSYAKKLAEVREWMDNLEREMNCGPDDWRRKILCLCREMLHEERDKRPEAFRLENELSSFQLSKGCPAPCTCTGNETLTNDFMLVEASKRGDRKTVASLLANNSASPNAVGALHQASIHNHPYVVRALLRYQGNVNLLDHSKQTPLHCAASYGNGEIVDILLNNEARATFRDDGGQTALHCVAGDGNGEIVQMLLDRGDADIMAKDSKDQTALHFAARRGHEEVVKILLDRGADRNWADREGRTALHFAAGYGSTEVVEMLLEGPCEGENPVNVNVQDNYKWSALHFAVRGKRAGGRYENVIEKLIGRGADVRMKDGEGLMALMHAKMNNYDKRAKLLEDALDKASMESSINHQAQAVQPGVSAKPEDTLALFFERRRSLGQQYVEYAAPDIQIVAKLLQKMGSDSECSTCPRIHIILRTIGALNFAKLFSAMTDMWFPFPPESLPRGLRGALAREFQERQNIVLTKTLNLEGRQHCNLHNDCISTSDYPIPNQFERVRDIGPGGFSYVYAVRARGSSKEYALKLINREDDLDRALIEMQYIQGELDALKKLKGSRHFIQLRGSYTSLHHIGFVMWPVAEGDLENFISEVPGSDHKWNLLWRFFGCLASAIEDLHFHLNIRHKDITPKNILVRKNNVVLTDFGVAFDWTSTGQTTTRVESKITLQYCSPEAGSRNNAPRRRSSDIWSLGCVYLEMVTALRRHSITDLRTHFTGTGSGQKAYWENKVGVSTWIEELRKGGDPISEKEVEAPLNLILKMLEPAEKQRPDARELIRGLIAASNEDQSKMWFCEDCHLRLMGVLNHGTEGPISTVEQDNVEKSEGEKWLQDNGFTAQGSDRRKAGRVAIEWAISHRSIAVVHLLLKEAGVNLSRKFKNGDAPLHAAVRIGDIEIMRALVEDDEEIMNEKNDEGWTPLHIAGQSTQIEPLKQLLDLGADVTAPSAAEGCRGFTVFHCVASEGTYEMAKLLLERGVDVTAMDSYKIRPLARLADKNYGYSKPYRKRDSWDEALAVLLIDNGADVNAQDFWGATALHRAAAQGNATMIKTLIKCGADVTIEDGSGKTPLGWAEYHPEVHGLLSFPVSNDWEIL